MTDSYSGRSKCFIPVPAVNTFETQTIKKNPAGIETESTGFWAETRIFGIPNSIPNSKCAGLRVTELCMVSGSLSYRTFEKQGPDMETSRRHSKWSKMGTGLARTDGITLPKMERSTPPRPPPPKSLSVVDSQSFSTVSD